MNHQPPPGDISDQRCQGQNLYFDRSKQPLDVQYNYKQWDRFDYNHVSEYQRNDSRHTNDHRQQRNTDYRSNRYYEVNRDSRSFNHRSRCELNESRGYNKYRGKGHFRGRSRESRDHRGRSRNNWKKSGGSFREMQAKRPSDIDIERHEKKRRLTEGCSFQDGRNRNMEDKLPSNEAIISAISNFLEKRDMSNDGKPRSSSRESLADSRRSSSREGSQGRSSKDRKIVKSSKSDSDRSQLNQSKDSRKRHDSSAHSSLERQSNDSDVSKSTVKIVNTKPNSAIELAAKHKSEEEKKKEKALCDSVTVPANSTACNSGLKSTTDDKVSVQNIKLTSKGTQDKPNLKPESKHRNVVHIKPKPSWKTADSGSSSVSSGVSSNSVGKKILPKIPKIPTNSGGSKDVAMNETKKSSTKQHRHSLGNAPLQPSKSAVSVDGKQHHKKKHRHSSGHVQQPSPQKMVVTSQTVSEKTDFDKDLDTSANFLLSERDESLPHLVHKKRHSRVTDSKSPSNGEKTIDSGLPHKGEKGVVRKEDSKKVSKDTEEDSHRLDKTTQGKENILSTNVSKISSKSSGKDSDKHRLKIKSLHKKTVSNSKEHEKHNTSVRPENKEKVNEAQKKGLNLEKHSKSGEAPEGKKTKPTEVHKKEGTGKEVSSSKLHHKKSGDSNMEPFVSVKKLPYKTVQKVSSDVKKDDTKTVESDPVEKPGVISSAPATVCADKVDSVANRERMSLFDLFKDSSQDQPRHKHSKLSLKKTPDKLSKGKQTSSTKTHVEQKKPHHIKRKMDDKANESAVKKAKIPHNEEDSATECSEASMNISKSPAESNRSTSVINQSTLETDVSSSGVSEKDVHNESDLSVDSSSRHMDESCSGFTSFSLSSCMSSPSFNKSDAMLSDNASEMETTSNTPGSEVGLSLKTKNPECNKIPSVDLYDRRRSFSALDESESDDDGSGRLVIDLNTSITQLPDTGTKETRIGGNVTPLPDTGTKETRIGGNVTPLPDTGTKETRIGGNAEVRDSTSTTEELGDTEMRESGLNRTSQMDETIPYAQDDSKNSSLDQHQATALLRSETSTPDPKSRGNTPSREEKVPHNMEVAEGSSVDLVQNNTSCQSDTVQLDPPLVTSGKVSEMEEKFDEDTEIEGSENQSQTMSLTQSDTTADDLSQVSNEPVSQVDVTEPSCSGTTEGSHSDASPKPDTTPKQVTKTENSETLNDGSESQQLSDDKLMFKFPRPNTPKQKLKHSDEDTAPMDDMVSSQDEIMDVSCSVVDDKDDIRYITYDSGSIEMPWTPMPATPYISYSQEEDALEDDCLPEEETVDSPVSDGREITTDQEMTDQEMGIITRDQETADKEKSHDREGDSSSNIDQLDVKPDIHAILSGQSFADAKNQTQTDNIVNSTSVHSATSLSENQTPMSDKNSSVNIPECTVNIKEEPQDDVSITDSTIQTSKSHTDRLRHAGITRSSSADQLMTQNCEPSRPSIIRSQSVGEKSMAGLSDRVMVQTGEPSKPSVLRSQSVGGESNVLRSQSVGGESNVLRSQSVGGESNASLSDQLPSDIALSTLATTTSASECRRAVTTLPSECEQAATPSASDCEQAATPSASECRRAVTTSPSECEQAATPSASECEQAITPSALDSDTFTANVDLYNADEINLKLNAGALTLEQHDFVAKVTKGLDQLRSFGGRSIKVPLKHNKVSTTNDTHTSFGYFSLKHLTDKNRVRCIECNDCLNILSPREFIVHLCGSARHMQFEIDTLLQTTIEFCTSPSDNLISDKCARALLILIFKLERSVYRTCQQSQIASSPTAEADLTPTSITKPLSGVIDTLPSSSVATDQPAYNAVSSLVNFLTTNPCYTQTQASSARSALQGNNFSEIDETISASLAMGEYLSNIQEGRKSQPRTEMDSSVGATAISQGTGNPPLTPQVRGQPLQLDGTKSAAPQSVGIGQSPSAPVSSYRTPEMEHMLQCMQQSSSLKRNSRQSFGSAPPNRVSRHGMEDQRSHYGRSRIEDPKTFNQVPMPESRVYNPPGDQTYHGLSVRDRPGLGQQLPGLVLPNPGVTPQSWPGNVTIPSTCSRTPCHPGGQLSSMAIIPSNRTLEDIESLHAANPFQTGSYSTGQLPNRSNGHYQANTSVRFTTGDCDPQSISRNSGFTRSQANNGPNSTLRPSNTNCVPSGNFGHRVDTSIAFQSGINTSGPQIALGPQCNSSATASSSTFPSTSGQCGDAVGQHGIVGHQNNLSQNIKGLQCSNISGSSSSLGPQSTLTPGALGTQQNKAIGPQSSSSTTIRKPGITSASGPQQPASISQSSEAINSVQDQLPPSAQERFWDTLGNTIQSEEDAYQLFVIGQMVQRRAVEWFRDTLQNTRLAMEKMDKEHKEEMRKRKESEETVTKKFNTLKSLVENFKKKAS